MYVNELEHLRQSLAEGALLDQDTFQKSMALLLPEAEEAAISKWADFVQDCVDMGQYVDFVEEEGPAALSRWYDTMLAGFVKLSEQFGQESAVRVCELGLNNCVLYPYEMERAAEEVRKGSSAETILNLMIEGKLEAPDPVFPKLREVLQDEPRQEPNSEITF